MSAPWKKGWFESTDLADPVDRELWRGVEAQHVVATLRLVDSVQEQELLERVLDASKPPVPAGTAGQHYLLFTPFRYRSPHASRFRRANDPGAFYGADDPLTVAAELGFWRRRFLMDSEPLRTRELETVHTFFVARFRGTELDISRAPWDAQRKKWRNSGDYSACHELAAEVRSRGLASIRYESARREGHPCNVVFEPQTLGMPRRQVQQTWACKTTATKVMWAHDRELFEFAQGD